MNRPRLQQKTVYGCNDVETGGYCTLRNYQDLIRRISPESYFTFSVASGSSFRLSCTNFLATPKTHKFSDSSAMYLIMRNQRNRRVVNAHHKDSILCFPCFARVAPCTALVCSRKRTVESTQTLFCTFEIRSAHGAWKTGSIPGLSLCYGGHFDPQWPQSSQTPYLRCLDGI